MRASKLSESLDSSARNVARGDDTRQRLIEAALEVFAEMGFEGASTRELAARAMRRSRRLLEYKVSAVVDLYELKLAERRQFVRLLLDSLIYLPRELWRPTLVILDEAHI